MSLSLYEHSIRKLRFMRASGEPLAERKRYAAGLAHNLGIDAAKALAEADRPGPIDGHPYTALAGQQETRSR